MSNSSTRKNEMNHGESVPLPALDHNTDLETVLEAWHRATVRLEQTHLALRKEVGRLTSELERKNRDLARKNRLADLGQMASHIAHEVRNNLVPVALYLSLLSRRLSNDSASLEILREIEAGVTALDVTVNDLLHFTSERDPDWTYFDVRQLVEEVIASVSPQLTAQEITSEIAVPEDGMIWADRDMFRRALLNLILNALDAMPSGGRLVITSHRGPNGLELAVADSGEGLSSDALGRAFEPFFTTKSGGTGHGLAIVYRVAEVHGGAVAVENGPEGGAAFTIRIPLRAMETAA